MNLATEIRLENEIYEHLTSAGWLHRAGDAAGYGRDRALFPEDDIGRVRETQPASWALRVIRAKSGRTPAIFAFAELLNRAEGRPVL